MEATHRHTWVYHCWMTDADQVASCRDADSEMECPETLSHLDMTIRVNAHDRLIEALEEIEVRAQMAQGRDAKLSPESEVYMLLDIMRHLQGDARSALAAARGEGE